MLETLRNSKIYRTNLGGNIEIKLNNSHHRKEKDMNYYNEIKNRIIDNEVYGRVKDYSKEKHNLITHYEVGKLLAEARTIYGEDIIGTYSKRLVLEVGKTYNARTLRRMRQLYQFFDKQKWSPLGTKLSISHIRQLFSLTDNNEINYYA